MIKRKSRLGNIQAEAEKPEYKDLINPTAVHLDELTKIVFSVTTLNMEDPHVDVRTYIESEKYSGPTKKGINFSIDYLDEVIEQLTNISDELKARKEEANS